jgi:hypothetical protein
MSLAAIPEGAGQPGLTYCAPIGYKCGGPATLTEQNWYVPTV